MKKQRVQTTSDDIISENVPNLRETEQEDTLDQELVFDEPFQKERIGWSTSTVVILLIVVFLVLGGIGAMIFLLPASDGHVMINEVMSSNDTAFMHPTYGSVDWVELYNPTDRDIDLGGFGLTNELKKQYKYTFPEGTVIPSKGYLLLYCTGGTNETDNDPLCTGFSLSQAGESLYLIDSFILSEK